MAKKNDSNRIDELLASVTEDMLGGVNLNPEDKTVRVERLILDLVRPDPIQPRRVLPDRVHFAFHNQQMTPSQALREIVKIAQVAARQRGRPFSNLLELLPNGDEDVEDVDIKLTPEERFLTDIVNLAVTIRDDGQVNPITVVDVSQGIAHQFRIETGERRYWASWILRDFMPGYQGDGKIDCIVVPQERSSVFRQAKENTARQGLTAIAMARQAALLLLTVHGYPLPDHAINNDFYRQALELDLRGKSDIKAVILNAMGGISKMHFSRYKALLNLSDEAMELADRHSLDEGVLRHVIKLHPDDHAEMVQHIIEFNLTTRQVQLICEQGLEEMAENIPQPQALQAQKFAKMITNVINKHPPESVAEAILQAEKGNVNLARARLQSLIEFAEQVEALLIDQRR